MARNRALAEPHAYQENLPAHGLQLGAPGNLGGTRSNSLHDNKYLPGSEAARNQRLEPIVARHQKINRISVK